MSRKTLTQQEREELEQVLQEAVRELDRLRRADAPLMERVRCSDKVKATRRKLGLSSSW